MGLRTNGPSDNKADPDVICVSESWLDNSILDTDIHIPNYSVFRKDRNRHGGGVLIYVTDSLSAVRRLDLEHIDVESVWIEVDISGQKVILASYYPGRDADPDAGGNLYST